MSKIIIPQSFISTITDKKYMYILNYPMKYKDRISILISRFKVAFGSIGDCCDMAKIPQATYNKIMEFGESLMGYCDQNGIDWEETDYSDFLEHVQMLKEAFILGTELRLKNIELHGKDVYDNDGKITKKGTIEADKFILSYSRRSQFKKEEDDVKEHKSNGINIVFNLTADQFKEASIESQKNLEKFKLNQNK